MMSQASKQMSKLSSGLLMYRMKNRCLEVLLVHPGGPFWAKKDEGAWSIPKGHVESGEDLLQAALREFQEEVGFTPGGPYVELGSVRLKSGKIVHGWACEGELKEGLLLRSNTFEVEWPPKSGQLKTFPEIDRVEFFPIEIAQKKIHPAQLPFLERLQERLGDRRMKDGGLLTY